MAFLREMSLNGSTGWLALVGAAVAGAAVAVAVVRPRPQPPKAFVLMIRLKFKPGGRSRFIHRWSSLAQFVAAKEPNTLTYELAYSKADPELGKRDREGRAAACCALPSSRPSAYETGAAFIYERYVAEADLKVTHNSSAPFKAVRFPHGLDLHPPDDLTSKRLSHPCGPLSLLLLSLFSAPTSWANGSRSRILSWRRTSGSWRKPTSAL
jgi:hypothetical protein